MTDAPKIDTQAPDALRDWPEWMDLGKQRCGWSNIAAEPGNMMRYSRADLSAAREAAAWLAGRDAAAEEAFYACGCKDSIEAITPPDAPAAALDRLIAERVREAVEAEREACAKVADDLSTQWWSECKRVFDHHLEGKSNGADDIANAIRARGSKEGRDNA